MVVRSAIFLEDSYIMNKAELISAISAETQMTKTAVEKVINAYIRVVTDELAQGGVVNNAKSCALGSAHSGSPLPLKRRKDLLYKFLTHADSVILYPDFV